MMHHVLTRFPEHSAVIEVLSQTNRAFEDMCHRYGHIVERLGKLDPSSTEEADALKKRRLALEEELLLTINSNRP
jgi:uncharacterized protein YdcH (DUF465 family)